MRTSRPLALYGGLALLAVLLAALLAACSGAAAPSQPAATKAAAAATQAAAAADTGNKPTIKLIANTWPASELNVAVAANLIKNKLGYPVEIVGLDEQAQWDALAAGNADASLEVWPSGHGERIKQYIQDQKVVEDGGPLGVVGRINWYVPKYVVDQNPKLATWEGFKDPAVAKQFATAETGDKGAFYAGPLGWTQYDQQIIDQRGLNFQVINTASEEALLAQVSSAIERKQPILFYFYVPHAIFNKYDLVPVQLPDCTADEYAAKIKDSKVDCAYPEDHLLKILNPKLKEKAPAVYQLLKNFNYQTQDQIEMLGMNVGEGKSVEDTAQAWIEKHPEVWGKWMGK